MKKTFAPIKGKLSIDQVVLDLSSMTIELQEGEKRTTCPFKFTGGPFPSGTNENPKWEQHAIFQKNDEKLCLEIIWDYIENEAPELTAEWGSPRALKIRRLIMANSIELTQQWYYYFCADIDNNVEELLAISGGRTPTQDDVEEWFAYWFNDISSNGMWTPWELEILDQEYPYIDWQLMTEYVLDSVCEWAASQEEDAA